jgi:hypothetical protein
MVWLTAGAHVAESRLRAVERFQLSQREEIAPNGPNLTPQAQLGTSFIFLFLFLFLFSFFLFKLQTFHLEFQFQFLSSICTQLNILVLTFQWSEFDY